MACFYEAGVFLLDSLQQLRNGFAAVEDVISFVAPQMSIGCLLLELLAHEFIQRLVGRLVTQIAAFCQRRDFLRGGNVEVELLLAFFKLQVEVVLQHVL